MSTAISIATIPGRETALGRCVMDLPRDIPIHVFAARQLKGKDYDLSKVGNLPKNVNLTVTEDTLSIRKLSYILDEPYEYIIQLDDDAIYTPETVPRLMKGIQDNPQHSISFRGKILQQGLSYYSTPVIEGAYRGKRKRVIYAPEGMIVDMFIGVWGVIHRKDYFDRSALLETAAKYPTADDVVISAHLRERGILVKVVALDREPKPLRERYSNALCVYNKESGETDRAINDLFYS